MIFWRSDGYWIPDIENTRYWWPGIQPVLYECEWSYILARIAISLALIWRWVNGGYFRYRVFNNRHSIILTLCPCLSILIFHWHFRWCDFALILTIQFVSIRGTATINPYRWHYYCVVKRKKFLFYITFQFIDKNHFTLCTDEIVWKWTFRKTFAWAPSVRQFTVKHALIREKAHHNVHGAVLAPLPGVDCLTQMLPIRFLRIRLLTKWRFYFNLFFVRPFYLCLVSDFFFFTLRPSTLNFSFGVRFGEKPDPLKVNFVFVELISYRAYDSIISINFDEGIEKIIIGHKTNIRSSQIRSDFLK